MQAVKEGENISVTNALSDGGLAHRIPFDTVNICRVYGPFKNGGGGTVSFGDMPLTINPTPYVFVGEMGEESTDVLQLHGNKGICMTIFDEDTLAYVKTTGTRRGFYFNCTVVSPCFLVGSDARFKTNVEYVSASNVDKLKDLAAVSYELKPEFEKFTGKISRYGFIAQEVEAVYPELVQTDSAGYKYVDYIGMIPLLVESLKAVEARSDSLENVINVMKKTVNSVPTSDGTAQGVGFDDVPVLYQNKPNPFSASTEIGCYLPYQSRDAKLYVYDLQGAQKLCKEVQGRGKTSVTINASELQAGMYLYSLIVDGSEIDSKRMILTD